MSKTSAHKYRAGEERRAPARKMSYSTCRKGNHRHVVSVRSTCGPLVYCPCTSHGSEPVSIDPYRPGTRIQRYPQCQAPHRQANGHSLWPVHPASRSPAHALRGAAVTHGVAVQFFRGGSSPSPRPPLIPSPATSLWAHLYLALLVPGNRPLLTTLVACSR